MMRLSILVAAMVSSLIGVAPSAAATSVNPLDDGGWQLVAHMSGSGGMFDGQGELAPGQSHGTFVANPTSSTPDFAVSFSAQATRILFITGDRSVWGIADYAELRRLIDLRGGDFAPNLDFEAGIDGVISQVRGNVLSRIGVTEDPWISLVGDHFAGINTNRIIWGESDYNAAHTNLKNQRGGLQVYVQAPAVPEPGSLALMLAGCASLAGLAWRRSADSEQQR